MLFKVKRNTTWNNHYDHDKREQGVVLKPTTKIELTLFGFIPIKSLHRYRKEYDGIVVNVDKRNNPIYTTKTREKFLKSKEKHAKTKDFAIENLRKIVNNAESEETRMIASKTINRLKKDKKYNINVSV